MYITKKFYGNNYIRVVNYHGTPDKYSGIFCRQLEFYKQNFSPVSKDDLSEFFISGQWHKKKPGLIISFDDGLRSNYLYAAPLLELYGFIGWFFVCPGLLAKEPRRNQRHMSWGELRDLSKRHVIGCHTYSHKRLHNNLLYTVMLDEICNSKEFLERELNQEIDLFCWVGGEEENYCTDAAKIIPESGYKYSFMTNCAPVTPSTDPFQIQRTNIESNWPLHLVLFYLSGLVDILYFGKRRRVNNITSPRSCSCDE